MYKQTSSENSRRFKNILKKLRSYFFIFLALCIVIQYYEIIVPFAVKVSYVTVKSIAEIILLPAIQRLWECILAPIAVTWNYVSDSSAQLYQNANATIAALYDIDLEFLNEPISEVTRLFERLYAIKDRLPQLNLFKIKLLLGAVATVAVSLIASFIHRIAGYVATTPPMIA